MQALERRVGNEKSAAIGGTMIRITTEWNGVQGSPYYTNMFFDGTLEAEADAAATAVGVFWTAIQDQIDTALEGEVLAEHAVIDPTTGQVTDLFIGTPVTINCSNAGAALPPATQGLIRWRTGIYVGGREVRGRTFVPSPTETSNDAPGVPSAAYIADLQPAADTLVSSSGLVVWSRANGQIAVVTGAQVWQQWASMRSRRD